jgi:hypothetical protein
LVVIFCLVPKVASIFLETAEKKVIRAIPEHEGTIQIVIY